MHKVKKTALLAKIPPEYQETIAALWDALEITLSRIDALDKRTNSVWAQTDATEYFCEAHDIDGHRYIIPYARQSEFDEWINAVYSDGDGDVEPEPPTWAKRIEGEDIIFTNYRLV